MRFICLLAIWLFVFSLHAQIPVGDIQKQVATANTELSPSLSVTKAGADKKLTYYSLEARIPSRGLEISVYKSFFKDNKEGGVPDKIFSNFSLPSGNLLAGKIKDYKTIKKKVYILTVDTLDYNFSSRQQVHLYRYDLGEQSMKEIPMTVEGYFTKECYRTVAVSPKITEVDKSLRLELTFTDGIMDKSCGSSTFDFTEMYEVNENDQLKLITKKGHKRKDYLHETTERLYYLHNTFMNGETKQPYPLFQFQDDMMGFGRPEANLKLSELIKPVKYELDTALATIQIQVDGAVANANVMGSNYIVLIDGRVFNEERIFNVGMKLEVVDLESYYIKERWLDYEDQSIFSYSIWDCLRNLNVKYDYTNHLYDLMKMELPIDIKFPAEIDGKTRDASLYHLAALIGSSTAMSLIEKAGTDVFVTDELGDNILAYGEENGNPALIKLLKQKLGIKIPVKLNAQNLIWKLRDRITEQSILGDKGKVIVELALEEPSLLAHNIRVEQDYSANEYFILHYKKEDLFTTDVQSYDLGKQATPDTMVYRGKLMQKLEMGDESMFYVKETGMDGVQQNTTHRILRMKPGSFNLIETNIAPTGYVIPSECDGQYTTVELNLEEIAEKKIEVLTKTTVVEACEPGKETTSVKSYRWSSRQEKWMETLD